jgi:hypothetical protein
MQNMALWISACVLLLGAGASWSAAPLDITLVADTRNPLSPQMGDHMKFVSIIRNSGATPAQGVVAWISLIQVDPGHEQPLDLEDWSAHKAVTQASLAPGNQITVEWPMRLIQAGDYRVVISTVERNTPHIITSPFVDFHVKRKPVVESQRILPIAISAPLVLGVLTLWRIRKRAVQRTHA